VFRHLGPENRQQRPKALLLVESTAICGAEHLRRQRSFVGATLLAR
jgi:hypothetical protein